jgi:hypothetical protein
LASAASILAALLVLIPLVDYVANVWPARPSDLSWRYGAEALCAGFLLTPCLGAALGAAVASWRAHFGTLRLLGFVLILSAVGLLPLCIDFALSAAQLRHSVPAEAMSRFQAGAAKVVVQYALVVVGLLSAGRALLRAARAGLAAQTAPTPPAIARPRPR